MKILVVGFSEQALKTIEVLLQLEFSRYTYCSVPRLVSESYTSLLPNVSANQQKCNYCIVDLDGIGIKEYSIVAREKVLRLTNNKPSIFVSRFAQEQWSEDSLLRHNVVLGYLYSRQELIDALNKILIGENDLMASAAYNITNMNIAEQPKNNTFKLAPLAERSKFSRRFLVQRWQDIQQYPIVEHLLEIFSQTSPYMLYIGDHELLVDPSEGSIFMKSFTCVLDYFILISGFSFTSFNITARSLEMEDFFQEKNRCIAAGYRISSLSLFVWQVFQEVLPHELKLNNEFGLSLKMKYMPNFMAMRSVPPYMQSVTAVCLTSAQNFDNLRKIFHYLQEEHLNRVFFLALLADVSDNNYIYINVADAPTLTHATETKPSSATTSEADKNDGVEKAKKTGFLSRLLKKLISSF